MISRDSSFEVIEEKFEKSDRDLKILENENVLDEFARTEIFQTRKLKNLQMDVFSGLSEFGKKLELQKNIQNQVLQKQRELNQKVQDLEKLKIENQRNLLKIKEKQGELRSASGSDSENQEIARIHQEIDIFTKISQNGDDEEARLVLVITAVRVEIIDCLESIQKLQDSSVEMELEEKNSQLILEKEEHFKTKQIMVSLEAAVTRAKEESVIQVDGSKQVKDEVEKLYVSRNQIRSEMQQLQWRNGEILE